MSLRSHDALPSPSRVFCPCVLAIGGLDPGGGAGLIADARAISRAGAFPCAAATVLTVQSTSGMRGFSSVAAGHIRAQCTEVLRHQHVRAIKVGALGSQENVVVVGKVLRRYSLLPSVVDAVMAPTRGRGLLLARDARDALVRHVLPAATLLTVNADEAEELTGLSARSSTAARHAAERLLGMGARAVLVKGGHAEGVRAVDVLAMSGSRMGATPHSRRPGAIRLVEVSAPRLAIDAVHGGGCVLASLIAGRLAVRAPFYKVDPLAALVEAVRWAKRVHHRALRSARDVGGASRVLTWK